MELKEAEEAIINPRPRTIPNLAPLVESESESGRGTIEPQSDSGDDYDSDDEGVSPTPMELTISEETGLKTVVGKPDVSINSKVDMCLALGSYVKDNQAMLADLVMNLEDRQDVLTQIITDDIPPRKAFCEKIVDIFHNHENWLVRLSTELAELTSVIRSSFCSGQDKAHNHDELCVIKGKGLGALGFWVAPLTPAQG